MKKYETVIVITVIVIMTGCAAAAQNSTNTAEDPPSKPAAPPETVLEIIEGSLLQISYGKESCRRNKLMGFEGIEEYLRLKGLSDRPAVVRNILYAGRSNESGRQEIKLQVFSDRLALESFYKLKDKNPDWADGVVAIIEAKIELRSSKSPGRVAVTISLENKKGEKEETKKILGLVSIPLGML